MRQFQVDIVRSLHIQATDKAGAIAFGESILPDNASGEYSVMATAVATCPVCGVQVNALNPHCAEHGAIEHGEQW